MRIPPQCRIDLPRHDRYRAAPPGAASGGTAAANASGVVSEVGKRYPGAEHVRLREAFRERVLGAAASWGIGNETLERVDSLKEAEMVMQGSRN